MRKIYLILLILLSSHALQARVIKGTVCAGDKPLPGVVVTDGKGFAVTDSKGTYSFDAGNDAEFVYIFTPSGYAAPIEQGVPRFFRRLQKKESRYEFDLCEMNCGEKYALLAVADPQVSTKRHIKRLTNETEPDMSAVIAEYKKAGIQPVALYLGDIVWDNMNMFGPVREHMDRLQIPVYSVIGNHDFDLNKKGIGAAGQMYRDNFGPTDYGFTLGNRYFIVMNNILYDTNKKYEIGFEDHQLEWIEQYLEYVPKGAEVYVAMHAPFAYGFENGSEITCISPKLFELFGDYKLSILSGHRHINITAEIAPGVMEHNVASAGGAWWSCDLNNDGTPNGYKVFEFAGDDVEWFYKSTGKDRLYQYSVYGRGDVVGHPGSVIAKVWDADQAWRVEWYQDGTYAGDMKRVVAIDPDYVRVMTEKIDSGKTETEVYGKSGYKRPRRNYIYYECTPRSGAEKIEIVITDRWGRTHRHVMDMPLS